MRLLTLFIACLPGLCLPELATAAEELTISGTISAESPDPGVICVGAIRLQALGTNGFRPPTKQEFFQASARPGETRCHADGRYTLRLAEGAYCVFAFADTNANGRWDPHLPEPLGWYADHPSGLFGEVRVDASGKDHVNFTLRAPRNFPATTHTVPGGRLKKMKGYTVLQLSGDAKTRGYAHGTTEYAIITRPNKREFDVAVASMRAEPWDAPYRDWTTFSVEELFSSD